MKITNYPISWHVDRLRNNRPYSYAMFGDGEWMCILGTMQKTQYGNECECGFRDSLKEVLKYKADNFFFATAEVLKNAAWTNVGEKPMDDVIAELGVEIDWHEKDMLDKEMKNGGLGPLIEALREKDVYIIGNKMLEGLTFLKPKEVIALDFPNWHLEMDKWVDKISKPGVYIIAGAIGSAVLAQRLHAKFPGSYFLHFGSIWDGFVGIGAMRGFRSELYADPVRYKEWAMSNLKGIVEDWPFPARIIP